MHGPGGDRLREHPSVRFADDRQVFDLEEEAGELLSEPGGGRHGRREKALLRHGPMTVGLFCMEAGSRMQDHVVEGEVILHTLSGRVVVHTDGRVCDVPSGCLLVLKPAVRHDITAERTSRVLMTFCLERGEGNG